MHSLSGAFYCIGKFGEFSYTIKNHSPESKFSKLWFNPLFGYVPSPKHKRMALTPLRLAQCCSRQRGYKGRLA